MKKLKLQALNLSNNEVLTRTHLKNVIGGGALFATTSTKKVNCSKYVCSGGEFSSCGPDDGSCGCSTTATSDKYVCSAEMG